MLDLSMILWDWLFPRSCLGCGRNGAYFCRACTQNIKKAGQICPVCEKPSPLGQTHTICQTSYGLDGLISCFVYEGIVRKAVHKLKYKLVTDLVEEFWGLVEANWKERKDIFAAFFQFVEEENPLVVPIPLHWYKENSRGFNQASLFGKRIADMSDLHFSDKFLVRTKNVPSQTKLTQKEREKNVKGVFSVSTLVQSSLFNILLVDDVWTTGATLKEAGRTLKEEGVKKVWGLTIAR